MRNRLRFVGFTIMMFILAATPARLAAVEGDCPPYLSCGPGGECSGQVSGEIEFCVCWSGMGVGVTFETYTLCVDDMTWADGSTGTLILYWT